MVAGALTPAHGSCTFRNRDGRVVIRWQPSSISERLTATGRFSTGFESTGDSRRDQGSIPWRFTWSTRWDAVGAALTSVNTVGDGKRGQWKQQKATETQRLKPTLHRSGRAGIYIDDIALRQCAIATGAILNRDV